MNRRAYWRKKKAKRLSPYRRLEAELKNAREALREAVDKYIESQAALGFAVSFLDRLNGQGKDSGSWTTSDVKTLAEIRRVAISHF